MENKRGETYTPSQSQKSRTVEISVLDGVFEDALSKIQYTKRRPHFFYLQQTPSMEIDSLQDLPRKRQRQETIRSISLGESYRPGGHANVDRGNSSNLRDGRSREDQEDQLDYGVTHHYENDEPYQLPPLAGIRSGPTDRNNDNDDRNDRTNDRQFERDPPYDRPPRFREKQAKEHNRPPPPNSKGKRKKKSSKPVASAKHSSIRAQIRSLEKLLSHAQDTMPADVRQDKERELEALNIDLRRQDEKSERAHMVSRYHFVRFLERRRAEARLKRLRKQQMTLEKSLQNTTDENTIRNIDRTLQPLKESYDETKVDLNYIIYAPLSEKYISLYPKENTKSANGAAPSQHKIDHDNGKESRKTATHPGPEDRHHQDQLTRDLKAGILPSATGEKPPLWYTIQEYTLLGDSGIQLLEKLRGRSGKGRRAIGITNGRPKLGVRESDGGKLSDSVSMRGKRGYGEQIATDGMGNGESDEDSDGEFFESLGIVRSEGGIE